MPRRAPLVVLGGLVAAALAAVLALGLTKRDALVYTLGVPPVRPSAPLRPGGQACQAPIDLPAGQSFERVLLWLGTYLKPGPAADVVVSDARGGRVLGVGHLKPGYPDIAAAGVHRVDVGHVAPAGPIRVCVVDRGPGRVAVYGVRGIASPPTSATLNGAPIGDDLAFTFEHAHGRPVLALAGDIAHRMSLFKLSWAGAWLYVLLAVAAALAVPALLIGALRAADRRG